jgi:hypothetical protein
LLRHPDLIVRDSAGHRRIVRQLRAAIF